jgi:hypothetical protein
MGDDVVHRVAAERRGIFLHLDASLTLGLQVPLNWSISLAVVAR